jgi:hypothetical protein
MPIRTVETAEYASAPHAEFFTRLMMAYNDLASMQRLWLILLSVKKTLDPTIFNGLETYIVRMESSYICEMANAFVTNVMPDKGHPDGNHAVFKSMIDCDANLKQKFEELRVQLYVLDAKW